MDTLLQNIRNAFMGLSVGSVLTVSEPDSPEEIIVAKNASEGVMVGIQIDDNVPKINENFASCHLFDSYFSYGNENKRYLFLGCRILKLRHEFASLCCEFLEPGPNYIYRKELLKDPLSWWKKWKDLIGNSITEKNVYCVIAEMMTLDLLFRNNKDVSWLAAIAGVRDIEANNETIEVKSTIQRSGYEATISSSFQLDSQKPLSLYFFRMEKNDRDGYSIEDLYNILLSHGYNSEKLIKELANQGIDLSNHISKIKYKCLELIKYKVDEDFPKIVDSSFVGGQKPKGINTITYSIDLNVVPGQKLETFTP